MTRRAGLAAAVLLAWVAGLALLVRREYFRAPGDRLEEVALHVSPDAHFYAVEYAGRQIGYASSAIDTAKGGFRVTQYFVADVPVGGSVHRTTAQLSAHLTRRFGLSDFSLAFDADSAPISVAGQARDSVLQYALSQGAEPPDTQRVRLTGPLVLPTLVPMAAALGGERLKVGNRYTIPTFDPLSMSPRAATVRVLAESVLVVGDSARLDAKRSRWVPAHQDTVRAWRVTFGEESGFTGWVDEQGQLVDVYQSAGFTLRRVPYEVAFENWRLGSAHEGSRVRADRDILETTAIAASAPLRGEGLGRLRVRLSNVDLAPYEVSGGRQSLSRDTLTIVRETAAELTPGYTLPADSALRARFAKELAAEPLLQSRHPVIVRLASTIASKAARPRDPKVVAEAINRWVHDSLAKTISLTMPSALQVLRARKGDCNEHTQLFVALARAAGIPARSVAGLALIDNKFYYHAWPEVYLGRWVAVDPTFGDFPADAAHLRFVVGGLARQAEMLSLIGRLKIEVVRGAG